MPVDKWITSESANLPLPDVARRAVVDRLGGVLHFLPRAAFLWQEDPEHIHSLRVSSRRAAAALRLFGALGRKKRMQRMIRLMKRVRKSADSARDVDVYLERLRKREEPAAATLVCDLVTKRRSSQRSVVDAAIPLLKDERFARRIAKLPREFSKASGELTFGDWCSIELGREWKRFLRSVPPKHPQPDQLHEFRIAGKAFRYSLEILAGGLPSPVRQKLYPQVEELQNELGAIQDHAVAAQRLADWRTGTRNDSVSQLLSKLEDIERESYATKEEAFRNQWHPERIRRLEQLVQQAAADNRGI
jgi:CHAD domain-containing protein